MLKNTLIIGAGEAGKMVAREILDTSKLSSQFKLLGFLDDDPLKKSFWGIPVLGSLQDAEAVLSTKSIHTLIIAIPSASRSLITSLLTRLMHLVPDIKIVPGIYEIIEGDVHWRQIREIKPEDLLGREEVGFELEKLIPFYQDKKIFITGAGGSIGSEIFKQFLKLPLHSLTAFGRGENNIHYLLTSYGNDQRTRFIIGNVQDQKKIFGEVKEASPDFIFHAAAHKHVPLMESFPEEAVKNNILGTYYTALAALENHVPYFILVSTDKAVNPTSVMGATKRFAEKMILTLNARGQTRFLATRFGNVLGSRGSVIPTFMKQIQSGGPLTITHAEIERFFMSIPEASRLVIKAPTVSKGDIFVLNMGRPIKILELAKNLLKLSGKTPEEIPIVFTGLRPGEKINEELYSNQESLRDTEYEKLMILENESAVFSPEALPAIIEEFRQAAFAMDKKACLALLAKYVPEFKPPLNSAGSKN